MTRCSILRKHGLGLGERGEGGRGTFRFTKHEVNGSSVNPRTGAWKEKIQEAEDRLFQPVNV